MMAYKVKKSVVHEKRRRISVDKIDKQTDNGPLVLEKRNLKKKKKKRIRGKM